MSTTALVHDIGCDIEPYIIGSLQITACPASNEIVALVAFVPSARKFLVHIVAQERYFGFAAESVSVTI